MTRKVASGDRMVMLRARRALVRLAVVFALMAGPAASVSAQPPPTTAAQDGFVAVDESKPQEHLPAAPLVMTAYGIAWVVIFGYVWSLWSRLSRVEREIGEVSRRIEVGTRR